MTNDVTNSAREDEDAAKRKAAIMARNAELNKVVPMVAPEAKAKSLQGTTKEISKSAASSNAEKPVEKTPATEAVSRTAKKEEILKAKKTTSVKKAAKSITAKKSVKKKPAKKTTAKKHVSQPVAGKKTSRPAAHQEFASLYPFMKVGMEAMMSQGRFPGFSPTQTQTMETIMSKSTVQFEQITQEAADMGRQSMEAFLKSGAVFAKGFEEISRTALSMMQTAAEKQAQFAKTALGSKTINELAETQGKMAQASFDDFMQSATKISEMSVKLLSEASEPLNAQANKAMQKANNKMAA